MKKNAKKSELPNKQTISLVRCKTRFILNNPKCVYIASVNTFVVSVWTLTLRLGSFYIRYYNGNYVDNIKKTKVKFK